MDIRGLIERGSALAEAGQSPPAIALFASAYMRARHDDPLRDSALTLAAGWAIGFTSQAELRHKYDVSSAEFSPDGRSIFTGSDWIPDLDHVASEGRFWDCATGTPLGEPFISNEAALQCATFVPDGRTITTQDRIGAWRSCLWDVATGKQLDGALWNLDDNSSLPVAYSPDGRIALVVDVDKETAGLWDIESNGSVGQPLQYDGEILAATFSKDGGTVVTGCYDKIARVYNARTGQPLGEPMLHEGYVDYVYLSPDGQTVLTQCVKLETGGRLWTRLWDTATGLPQCDPMHHESDLFGISFNPAGRLFVTAGRDHTARFWDASTGLPWGNPLRHSSFVFDAKFSPDGRLALTGADDNVARLWDVATCKPIGKPISNEDRVAVVAFNPETSMMVTGGGKVARTWAVPRLPDHPEWIRNWSAATTGLVLSENGEIHNLSAIERHDARVAMDNLRFHQHYS